MKFTTTLVLALFLSVLALAYVYVRQSPSESQITDTELKLPTAAVARDLFEDESGAVVRIAIQRAGKPEWVFERTVEDAQKNIAIWRVVEPFNAKAAGWELDRIAREVRGIKYEISHPPGDSGSVTPKSAGLDPPQSTVTLKSLDGSSATVEIGLPASASETYARRAGSDEIIVAKSNLRALLKKDVVEYRDLQVWDIAPDQVRRVEIVDRAADDGPAEYIFVNDGLRWMLEAPVAARATDRVKDALQAISRLRVRKWIEDSADSHRAYGLDPAALTLRMTVEEQVLVEPTLDEPDDENAIQPTTELETTVYTLHVSNVAPIGEDSAVYVRTGDESVVGTILKTAADKLRPVMNEWREMRVVTADVDRAGRIELNVADQRASLIKTPDGWAFEADGERADTLEVQQLLASVRNLDAVVFVEPGAEESQTLGVDRPQAEVRITIPGAEAIETLTVGNFTDEAAKRLVYVRRALNDTIAKVRSADVAPLLRPISTYRDRTVLDLQSDRIQRIAIRTESPFSGEGVDFALARDGGAWRMIEPVSASVRADRAAQLVSFLSRLTATTVLPDDKSASEVGLDAPDAVVSLTYSPPPEIRIEPADESGEDPSDPVEVQPPDETIELAISAKGAKRYAKLSGGSRLYEIPNNLYDQILLEYRSDAILAFDAADVIRFSIQSGDASHAFVRKDADWAYESEPDLPLSSTKVENLLLQIKDLKTARYAAHGEFDRAEFGLHDPMITIALGTGDGTEHRLYISAKRSGAKDAPGFFAAIDESPGVFVVSETDSDRLKVSLDDLEAA